VETEKPGDGLDDLIVGAHNANSKTGKSYIIFGKIDSTVIELSAIASGTGGFVINGVAVNILVVFFTKDDISFAFL
jgi:hypothetical protein